MSETDKPIAWIQSEIKSPPFSAEARLKAVFLLRRLQKVTCCNYLIPDRCHQLVKAVTNYA